MGDKTLGLKGASPADKQAAKVASNIMKHEGKGSAVTDRKDEDRKGLKDNEDRNPVTGKVETHTRLATPEEGERIQKGEEVTGRPGDEADRKDAKGKKVKTDQQAAADFIDPANSEAPKSKSGKSAEGEDEEGMKESAEAANARVRRSATGNL